MSHILQCERRRALAQLRSSNHRLNCETGRYDLNKSPKYNSKLELDNKLWRKFCKICYGLQAETLSHLPFFEPIIEDEQHFLATCPLYQNTRLQLNDTIESAVVLWDTELLKEIFTIENVVTLSKYVLQLLDTRFPKDKDVANTEASTKTKKQKTRMEHQHRDCTVGITPTRWTST